ncbi:MAG: outer membrane protein assembly factor BamB family protein [Planctomycetota bacterium]|jgi:outer membrane protein assembly factor BamB
MEALRAAVRVTLALMILAAACAPAAAGEAAGRGGEALRASGLPGGFCLHLGASDGKLTAELGASGKFLVHALVLDAKSLPAARAHVRSRKLYGRVSLDTGSFKRLPYAENLVNLLVVENPAALSAKGFSFKEAARVVSPNGLVCVGGKAEAGKLSAAGFQDVRNSGAWTTARKVRPKEMDEWTHWRYGPTRTATSKDMLVGPTDSMRWIDGPRRSRGHGSPPPGCVSAGGRLFYVYDYGPLFYTAPHSATLVARDAFSGVFLWKKPVECGIKYNSLLYPGRAIVATGDFLYAPLKAGGPLVKMDAATGREIKTYTGSKPDSVVHQGRHLLLLEKDTVRLIDEATGAERWKTVVGKYDNRVLVANGRVYVHVTRLTTILCLNLADGGEVWKRQDPSFISAEDGSTRWTHKYSMSGRGSTRNVFFSAGLVWVHNTRSSQGGGEGEAWHGVDPASGQLKKSIPVRFQDKCAPGKATERYLITGRMNFTDVKSGKTTTTCAARASCSFGAIPANGMNYTFPTDCRCFPQLKGIMGLGTLADGKPPEPDENGRLERGPGAASGPAAGAGDWPVYRGSPERRGSTDTAVPAEVREIWAVEAGGKLSAPTIAGGKVFVSSVDRHQVHGLDAADGKRLWTFETGGRVDGPPTYFRGLVLFGCRDGWFYCLSASDGKLVWRFRAAPADRRVISYGQPESAWPAPGSVLIFGGRAYVAAGRHTGLDGGIHLYCMDPASGKVHWQKKVPAVYYQDLLVKGRDYVFMGPRIKINPKDGAPVKIRDEDRFLRPAKSSPFIDDTYAVRTFWKYRQSSGQMLAADGKRVAGFTSFEDNSAKSSTTRPGQGDHKLFVDGAEGKGVENVALPIRPRALLLAADRVFLAGPEDAYPAKRSMLVCHSASDGKQLSKIEIASPPVFDGIAAANGRLYISTADGRLRCFGGK